MLAPVMAALSAPPSLSLGSLAPGLAGGHSPGRGPAHAHAADSLALSGTAQSLLAGTASDAVAGYLKAAVDQLQADLTKLFLLLGVSRDVARRMAQSIAGALTAGFAATSGLTDQLAQAAGAGAQDSGGSSAAGFSMNLSMTTETLAITIDRAHGTISIDYSKTSVSVSIQAGAVEQSDPLIIDLGGDGITLSGLAAGKDFDLNGDGTPERASWITGNDALLAYDRNGNGMIDNGGELFGDQHGAADGFAELKRFDANGDGAIDGQDPVFGSLLLLDARGGTKSLADAGITRIHLDTQTRVDLPLDGGRLVATAAFDRADGSQGTVGEALCDVHA